MMVVVVSLNVWCLLMVVRPCQNVFLVLHIMSELHDGVEGVEMPSVGP